MYYIKKGGDILPGNIGGWIDVMFINFYSKSFYLTSPKSPICNGSTCGVEL